VRFALIEAEKANHDVTLLCRMLKVSRQGFYAWLRREPCRRQRTDETLGRSIRRAFDESNGRYGSPRVHLELRAQGLLTSRKRVARLMWQHGLIARPRRPRFVRTTDSRHGFRIAPNRLARDFRPDGPNRAWASDITYIPSKQGWLYLAVVIDLFSRKVVGWSMRADMDRRLTLAALEMATATRKPAPGLVHHSDRGVQYASDDYQRKLRDAEMVSSMSRRADCWDNAVVESFFSTLKQELVYRHNFTTRQEAKMAIFEYLEGFYNRVRRHSTLGYLSPMEYESRSAT
jgi:putative transposase